MKIFLFLNLKMTRSGARVVKGSFPEEAFKILPVSVRRGLESFLSNSLRFRDLAAKAQGGLTLAPNHTAN